MRVDKKEIAKIAVERTIVLGAVLSIVILFAIISVILSNSTSYQHNVSENKNIWQISTVCSFKEYVDSTSIVVDSEGGVHMCLSDGRLVYAYKPKNSSSWNIRVLAERCGECFMTIDSNDGIHIVYNNGSFIENSTLIYLYKPKGGSWKKEIIDSAGKYESFGDVSIAVDDSHNVYVVYTYRKKINNGSFLKYAYRSSESAWKKEIIYQGYDIWFIDIDIDSKNNNVYVVFTSFNNTSLRGYLYFSYKNLSSSRWRISQIDKYNNTTACGGYSSISVDSSSGLHLCYQYEIYDSPTSFIKQQVILKYAYKPFNGVWQIFTIDSAGDVGGWCSIAVDSEDCVHISYYDYSHGSLKYAYKSKNGKWNITTVDDYSNAIKVGFASSIAVDKDGGVHIAYGESTNKIKYAYKPPSKVFAKNIQKRAVDMDILSSYSYMNFACSARIIKFEEVLINEYAREF